MENTKNRVIVGLLICTLTLFGFTVPVKAEANQDVTTNNQEIVETYPEAEQLEETFDAFAESQNVEERGSARGNYIIEDDLEDDEDIEADEEDEIDNTDPNNALLIENEDTIQGILTAASELRWYGFILENESKITIELQTVSSVDGDLYLFALDENTSQLSLVGGSVNEGLGVHEFYCDVLSSGIYYLAVSAYEGSGQYAFAFYATQDTVNEPNESAATSAQVGVNTTLSGKIDNPYDMDYYSFTLTSPMIMELTYNVGNYQFDFINVDSNAHIYLVSQSDNLYQFGIGTYCFRVYSSNGNYNAGTTYTVNLNKIANIANNSNSSYYMVNKGAKIVFQSDPNGNNMYVNGNAIDVSYTYNVDASNSAGSQRYNISMTNSSSLRAKIYENQFMFDDPDLTIYMGMTMPDTVNYMWGTKGVGPTGNVLELSVYSLEPVKFYQIHCICSGAYAANNFYSDLNFATVFIDPNTGRLVDIAHINYFYDIATGSNNMMFTRPYSTQTKYYYPYYNGEEPTTW